MARDEPPRLGRLPEQFFVRIVGAARAAAAEPGPRFIDLGRGNPDLPPPPHALEAMRAAAADLGIPTHGYPPFRGLPELLEAVAERYRLDHGVELDPASEIAVVPGGAKFGIITAALSAAAAGSAVLVPDPGYPDYLSGVALADAEAVPLPLERPAWQPDFDAVAPSVRARLALTFLNYPSNPCATCEAPGTFEAAVAFAHATGSWLVSDLAYGFLAFDGRRARSVLEVDGAREVAAELWSTSKIYGMAGWRIGFLVGNAELVRRTQLLIDHALAGIFTPLQRGVIAALTGDQEHVRERLALYAARRARMVEALGVHGLVAPEGTFYAWWRLPAHLTQARLVREQRVAVAPGEGFGARGSGYVRLSLALPDDALDEGLERLARAAAS